MPLINDKPLLLFTKDLETEGKGVGGETFSIMTRFEEKTSIVVDCRIISFF